MTLLADLVLLVHFAIAAFLVVGMLLIPLGAHYQWSWVRSRRYRQIHIGLMALIALEAIFHITCPLTILEAFLRNAPAPNSFWMHHLSTILYWEMPIEFFTVLYLICALWLVFLWWRIPPRKL